MLGTSFFERQFARKAKMIFDFDDSIWVQNVSAGNKMFSFFKNAEKTKDIIAKADLVFAGNNYLAGFARQFNENVVIVPTTIDTEIYKPILKNAKEKICIGWSGSITTIEHMETKMQALKAIKNKYGNKVYFKIIGDGRYYNEDLKTQGLPWKKETEIHDMAEFDIGIMPLPDTEWAKGKCGLKGLQYMALGVPTIMSPVGVNSEIIQDGENGFLADSDEEWVNKLSLLIESFELRRKIGNTGRKTVEEKYSIHTNSKLYLRYFDQLTS
jgi:glycosyltransferase involved in cell wall biosynthesis